MLVLGSTVQVFSTNPLFEGWHHFRKDQERLLKLLQPYKDRLLFLSGDVHFAEVNLQDGFLEVG